MKKNSSYLAVSYKGDPMAESFALLKPPAPNLPRHAPSLKSSSGALLRSESNDKCGSANKGHHLYILSASTPQQKPGVLGCESRKAGEFRTLGTVEIYDMPI